MIDVSTNLLQQGVTEETTLKVIVVHKRRQRLVSRQKERMSNMEVLRDDDFIASTPSPTTEKRFAMEAKVQRQ